MRRPIVILLACTLLAPLPLHAAHVTAEELREIVGYTQRVHAIYDQGLTVSAEMSEAEELVERFADGQLPEAEMRRGISGIRVRARRGIDDYAAAVAVLPSPPRIRDAGRRRGLAAFSEMVGGLTAHLERQWRLLPRLADAAASGDERAYDLASADVVALSADLLEAENTASESARLGVEPGHPEGGLYHASIGSNLAMRAALILLEDSLRGTPPRTADAKADIERGLARAERGIEDGRRDAELLLAQFRAKPARTETDRISRTMIENLVDSYRRAFDHEARIAESMRRFLNDIIAAYEAPADDSAERLAEAGAFFQSEFAALVDARVEEQRRRLKLAEEFSAALAAQQ